MNRLPPEPDQYVIAMIKGSEKYVFIYDAENKSEILRTLGRFAGSPELSFTWFDAACLCQRVRELCK